MTIASESSPVQVRQQRLSQLIKKLLEDGWTQSSLAEAVGVDFSTVHRWLKGKTIPESDSKNFRQLAKVSGGNPMTLQLYLDGEISLLIYRNGLEKKVTLATRNDSNSDSEDVKKEVLDKIYTLNPKDIAEVISLTVAYLAKQV
ncbi:hypothetical protein NUACC21_47160 [Scytonema sp. NUACC21]